MSQVQTYDYPQLGESVDVHTMDSGVQVAFVKKPGFSTAAGYFGLRFGSTDVDFQTPEGDRVQVPDGSAHFLEHKLFEGRDEKVFDRFGKIGARFNGGTGFHSTTYFFISAGKFAEGLDVLLDFVQHPLITEERVEKEKGIIEQEVRMYEDDPGFRGTFLLHRALFHALPIRIPPGGLVEDVRSTTAVHLQSCYDAFYRPENLRLSLAGDLDADAVISQVRAALDPPHAGTGVSHFPDEPPQPAADWVEEDFAVTRPYVWIGWRDETGPGLGEGLLQRRILSSLVLDLALDLSSPWHAKLYDAKVIDDTFSTFYRADRDYGYAAAVGMTDNPQQFVTEVRSTLAQFAVEGPEPQHFERMKRAAWGSVVSGLQTPDAVASSVLQGMLHGLDPLPTLRVLEGITLDQLVARAREMFRDEQSAVAMLRPVNGQ